MSLRSVLAEVMTERAEQDRDHGGPVHDDTLTMPDWVWIIVRHLGLGCDDEGHVDIVRFRKQLVRAVSTGVAAIEAIDRQRGVQ